MTRDYIETVVRAIDDGSDRDPASLKLRRTAAVQFAELATAVWKSRQGCVDRRSHAHKAQRLASALSAGVAGSSGVALALGLSGLIARIFGSAVAVIGIAGVVVAAVWPEAEYESNRAKARHYEELWRDIWAYATLTLPVAEIASIGAKLNQLDATEAAVGDG